MRNIIPLILLLLLVKVCAVEPSRKALPNGLRIITLPAGTSQLVTVNVLIDCSALDEPYQIQGIRLILLRSMLQGSANADGGAIRSALTAAGGILEGRVRQDTLELSATVPVKALPLALSALAEIICRPQLTEAGVKAVIAQAQSEADLLPSGPVDLADWYAQTLLYSNHPYSTDGKGLGETIQQVTPKLVQLAYKLFIKPDKTIISIVGQNLPAGLQDDVAKQFGEWERGNAPQERDPVAPPSLNTSHLLVREAPIQNTCVMLAFPVCGWKKADFLVLQLIEALLSGGTGSRLFRVVREQQHLAYDVSTRLPIQENDSYFSVYAVSNGRYLDATKTALIAELARLQNDPVPNTELSRAKAFLKGQYLLSHQSTAQHAFDLARYELAGFDLAYERNFPAKVDALTVEDIRRVANNFFTHYYLIVVLPRTLEQPDEKTIGLWPNPLGVQLLYGGQHSIRMNERSVAGGLEG